MRVTVSASRAAIGTIREKLKAKIDANSEKIMALQEATKACLEKMDTVIRPARNKWELKLRLTWKK
jgi:hypothetical protein